MKVVVFTDRVVIAALSDELIHPNVSECLVSNKDANVEDFFN